MARWLRRRVGLTWPALAIGTALGGGLLWGTLLLATDHTHDAGMAAAASAYASADQSRTTALAAHGLHPIIWNVPVASAREQLLTSITIETRFSGDVARITFPLSIRCDVSRVLAATERLKAAELVLIEESYGAAFSQESQTSYLDAITARGSADYTLRQSLGLAARLPLLNWWPSYC